MSFKEIYERDINIDGWKNKIGVASTIVKVDESSKINILREGSIKIWKKFILF